MVHTWTRQSSRCWVPHCTHPQSRAFSEEQRQDRLFAEYVNTCLKINQESTGYPGWAQTDEQKQQYVRDYQAKEGITLDPLLVDKNPGRKATPKLMLNSFWSKFGKNLHKKTTEAVTTPAHLFALVIDSWVWGEKYDKTDPREPRT